jgi:hypothetical protein
LTPARLHDFAGIHLVLLAQPRGETLEQNGSEFRNCMDPISEMGNTFSRQNRSAGSVCHIATGANRRQAVVATFRYPR